MDQLLLDIGSDVNVLTGKTWELMGKPTLRWSPIQLRLANKQKIIPLGLLSGVTGYLDGVRSIVEFEEIEIVDDRKPYPALLRIEWAFDKNAIINLKKRQMSFEDGKNRVTTPIDPSDGQRYVEPVKEEIDLDNIYNLTSRKVDYVDLTSDKKLSR